MRDLLRFIGLYRPHGRWIVLSLFLSCLTIMAQIGLLAISGWFIAAMGIAGAASASMNYFTPAAIIRTLAVMRTAGRYAERLVTHESTLRMTARFRRWFYDRVEPHAPAGIHALHSADMFGRMRDDIDMLERFFLQGLLPILTSFVCTISVLAIVLWVHAPLVMVIAPFLLCVGVIVPLIRFRGTKQVQAISHVAKQELHTRTTDMVQGLGDMLVYGCLEGQRLSIDEASMRAIDCERTLHRADAWTQAVTCLAIGCAVALGTWYAVPAIKSEAVPMAYMAMIPLLCIASFDAVAMLPAAIQLLPSAMLAAARVNDVTGYTPDHVRAPQNILGDVGFELRCDRPVVGYRPRALACNLSFTLHEGESLAIIGQSGIGKTSALHAITGLWPLVGGDVSLNGQPQHMCDGEVWRRHFAVAEQKPHIFAGTIRDNLRMACPNATDDDMRFACATAQLDVDVFPQGMDSYVGEHGMTLSGGERRRLAIARALLKPAPCLILDEPTDALDAHTADKVMLAVTQLAAHRKQALIVITHEPRFLPLFDDIEQLHA